MKTLTKVMDAVIEKGYVEIPKDFKYCPISAAVARKKMAYEVKEFVTVHDCEFVKEKSDEITKAGQKILRELLVLVHDEFQDTYGHCRISDEDSDFGESYEAVIKRFQEIRKQK